jgi:hypothetical protein
MFSFLPFFQKREGTIGGGCVWIARITCFHLFRPFVLTQEQKINYTSYHRYYNLVPSGGLWATNEGTCDVGESEVARAPGTRGHPPNPLSSPHCVQIQIALAQNSTLGNETRRQPTQTGSPSGPC